MRIARRARRRCRSLTHTILELDRELLAAAAQTAPALLALPGCGAVSAAKLLGEIGPIDAKTGSRSTLGFMNEMAFELRYLIADAGGLGRCDIDLLSHGLPRTLRNRGEYVRPIELVARQLTSRI